MSKRLESFCALAYGVVGPSHKRVGMPNQDSCLVSGGGDGVSGPLMVMVADGHGSARCFRSERGSRFAVETAAAVMGEYAGRLGAVDRAGGEELLRSAVVPAIVSGWRERVRMDLAREGVTVGELEKMGGAAGEKARQAAEKAAGENYIAYGSTLLVVMAVARGFAVLQVGDGDMLMVERGGRHADGAGGGEKVVELLPEDATLMADETTSLCQSDCEGKFRVRFVERGDVEEPVLIQLSTDGYGNSFSTRAGFEKTPLDYLALLREHGRSVLDEHMEQWLAETTGGGSGDDCTVGLMYRCELPPPMPRLEVVEVKGEAGVNVAATLAQSGEGGGARRVDGEVASG
ncbi:MAG TPA: PP2C family serine/threonine-protein phosphatase [Phycisphaerales bacterium]|nr:PP2C family serine/threonine-protein phosphatase [Phycisphaerales bacterium]